VSALKREATYEAAVNESKKKAPTRKLIFREIREPSGPEPSKPNRESKEHTEIKEAFFKEQKQMITAFAECQPLKPTIKVEPLKPLVVTFAPHSQQTFQLISNQKPCPLILKTSLKQQAKPLDTLDPASQYDFEVYCSYSREQMHAQNLGAFTLGHTCHFRELLYSAFQHPLVYIQIYNLTSSERQLSLGFSFQQDHFTGSKDLSRSSPGRKQRSLKEEQRQKIID
jgi:hypothetical protein